METLAPILAFPDFGKPFVLSINASDTAVGYVLGQINSQGLENVIVFGGRALRDQEKRWHINYKEGLTLIEAIKTFKAYQCRIYSIYRQHNSALVGKHKRCNR